MRKIVFSLLLCFFLTSLVFAETPIAPNPYEVALQHIEYARSTGAVILDLSNLSLSELPEEIASLDSVQYLLLGANKFSSFPVIINEMTAVETLDLSHNQLSSLPPEIGNMTSLQNLHLSANALTSLPPEIGNLIHLVSLSVDYNQLSSLPPEITQLVSLVSLYVNNNQLTDLPDDLGNLTNLCTLDISNNPLSRADSLTRPKCQAGTGQMPPDATPVPTDIPNPAPAYTDIRPTFTPNAIMLTYPTARPTVELSLGDAPMEGLAAPDSSWDKEKLVLAGVALLGVLVSFFLGLRLRRDNRKRKPKL
jgi:Leucine-rich repeat (LRR) protein